jgi:hypothetical protein
MNARNRLIGKNGDRLKPSEFLKVVVIVNGSPNHEPPDEFVMTSPDLTSQGTKKVRREKRQVKFMTVVGPDGETHSFHDSTLEAITVLPPKTRRERTKIEVILAYGVHGERYRVVFKGCANAFMAMDFDVLAQMGHCNTASFSVTGDTCVMRSLILASKQATNVGYDDDPETIDGEPFRPGCYTSRSSPIPQKLEKLQSYRHYTIDFFGGYLTIIAKAHVIEPMAFPAAIP